MYRRITLLAPVELRKIRNIHVFYDYPRTAPNINADYANCKGLQHLHCAHPTTNIYVTYKPTNIYFWQQKHTFPNNKAAGIGVE